MNDDQRSLFLHAFGLKKDHTGSLPLSSLPAALSLLGHTPQDEQVNQALLTLREHLRKGETAPEAITIMGPTSCGATQRALRLLARLQLATPEVEVITGLKPDWETYMRWLKHAKRGIRRLENGSAFPAHAKQDNPAPTVIIGEVFIGGIEAFEEWVANTYTIPVKSLNPDQFLRVAR